MNSKNLLQILAIFAIISLIALSGCISTDAPGVKSVSFTVTSGYTLAEFPSKRVLSIDFETGKTLLTKFYAGLKDKVPETTETILPKDELDSLKTLLLENGIGLGEKYSLPKGQAIADAQGAQIKILFAVPANERNERNERTAVQANERIIEIYPYSVELSGLQGKNLGQLQKIVEKLQELMDRMEKLPSKDYYLPSEVLEKVLELKGQTIAVQGFITENDGWKTIKDSLNENSAELYLQNSKNLTLFSGKKYNVIGTVNFCGSKDAQCAIFPNPSFSIEKAVLVETETVELSYTPVQCGGNPWEVWHKDLNRVYIRAPTEEEILKEYYSTVQGISIFSYKNIPAPPGLIVCMACSCPRGDTIQIEVSQNDKAKMVELDWKISSTFDGEKIVKTVGEREDSFMIQKINSDNVEGLWFQKYPIEQPNDPGTPKTLHIGDDIGYACEGVSEKLASIDFSNQKVVFTKIVGEAPQYGCPICLSGNTLIDTPNGNINVKELRTGMMVWTVDKLGNRLPAIILKAGKAQVPSDHKMVHIILINGKELFASQGHPTADGRIFGNIKSGDIIGNSIVKSVELVQYDQKYTYDILPAGETGFYYANGILVASTLK